MKCNRTHMLGGAHRSHVVLMVSGDSMSGEKQRALNAVAIETNKQFIGAQT